MLGLFCVQVIINGWAQSSMPKANSYQSWEVQTWFFIIAISWFSSLNLMISVSNNIQPQWLSPMLLSQIPIKHLLEQARSQRQEFKGLYAPLLQQINTHLPHLCLVDDWLKQEEVFTVLSLSTSPLPSVLCSPSHLQQGKPNLKFHLLVLKKIVSYLIIHVSQTVNSQSACNFFK